MSRRPEPSNLPLSDPKRGERLQRVLARAGVGARRACERAVEDGLVRVNGELIKTLPVFVDPERDRILVDGRPLRPAERLLYVMFHKPTRTLSGTRSLPGELDDADAVDTRRGVLDLVDHPAGARLIEIAPLDFDATGLVLLSNDGDLVNRLTHARYGVPRLLQAVVKGIPDAKTIDRLRKGVYLPERRERRTNEEGTAERRPPMPQRRGQSEGTKSVRLEVRIVEVGSERTTIELISRDGRDASAREVLTIVGFPPKKLTRLAIGPIELKGLALGRWREMERAEIHAIKRAARGDKDEAKKKGQKKDAATPKAAARASASPGKRSQGVAREERPRQSLRVVEYATRKPRVIRPEKDNGER